MTDKAILSGYRIFLAEDHEILAEELKMWVEDAGGTVVCTANSVEGALSFLGSGSGFDIAALDINLSDGLPIDRVTDELNRQGTPFVLITGDAGAVDRSDYWDAPCLDKPVSRSEFLATIVEIGVKRAA